MDGALSNSVSIEVNLEDECEFTPPVQIDIEQLYREHRVHLLRFVQRYVRQPEDAEDVVQNTFIEAVKCADRFSGLSKPSTWLFGIALNVAHNHLRRKKNSLCDPIDDEALANECDTRSDPAMLLEYRDMAQQIDSVLAKQSAKIRMTFEAVLDGASTYEEAAALLNIPIGTVRSRVSRVRSAVREECGYI